MKPGIGRLTLIATALLIQGLRPALACSPASFKEVAQRGGTIIMVRCQIDGEEMITCEVLEVWRGEKPGSPILISREDWGHYSTGGLEKRSDARYLMVVGANGEVGCALSPPVTGARPRIPGDAGTCVVPILDGHLPAEFRHWYDRSQGPPLSVGQLKADLLASSKDPFVNLARQSPCAKVRNRLFVIDEVLVFWDREGSCPDNSYGSILFGNTVDDLLCQLHDSIAGPMKNCPVPGYEEIFEIMIGHRDQPDLGLGTDHTVRPLPLDEVRTEPGNVIRRHLPVR